jgi:RepB DNA-primase from phage plasmid
MIQRILNSKNLVAFVLAAATGMTLHFRMPFCEDNIFLQVMALRSPSVFQVLKYSYTLFLFSTPYIGYSVVLSGLYIFALKAKQRIRAGRLPLFPDPRKRDDLFLVIGEVHNPRKQVPAENPQWLVIPERGLFTGVAILGAIGSGKTSCCKYPFAEQILAYCSDDGEKRIGGLVLEVKGDFCHRVKDILARHGRAEDYVEINRQLGETTQRITTAQKASSPEFQAWLRYKNANGADIYVGMNALQHHASTPTKDDIEKISHVYLDLDHGGTASLEALENSDLAPRPNYVLSTSPEKFQVVWKAEGMTIEEAEALNHAMVKEFDGDPTATDSTRVLCLPGFANKKYEVDFNVEARAESTQTYNLRDFKLHIDSQDAPRRREEVARKQSAPSSTLSQSEHDWAYAKRALARGDDPEEVSRRVTDCRADDKHDPAYYARHKVERPLKELQGGSADLQSCDRNITHASDPCREQ